MTRPLGEPSSAVPPEKPSFSPGGVKPSAGKYDGAVPGDDVLLTVRQKRRAAKEARRQAKDAAYDQRQRRKKNKDGTSWRGRHIVDERGLAATFPEPETPEFDSSMVRRRITHGAVLVLLLALVIAGLVLAGMVQRGELELKFGNGKPATAPVTCPVETLKLPANKDVTVNVFNGGSTEGQAGKVAKELKARGFVIGVVANQATEYVAPTIVISGKGGQGAALSMQRNFANSEYVQDDRKDSTVDVIVTSRFSGLVDAAAVDAKPGVLSCPRLSPPPSPPPSAVPPAPPAKPAAPAAG